MKLVIQKHFSFTRKQAERLLKTHVGDHGIVRYKFGMDEFYYPNGRMCQLCLWQGIGNEVILGEGISWRKAFEDAGVFFENGETYKI